MLNTCVTSFQTTSADTRNLAQYADEQPASDFFTSACLLKVKYPICDAYTLPRSYSVGFTYGYDYFEDRLTVCSDKLSLVRGLR
jgi:hypothetical protein